MSKKNPVTFAKVCQVVEKKTCCCQAKKKSLDCTVTVGELHRPCNLVLKPNQKDFILDFSPNSDLLDLDTLQTTLVDYFDQFNLSPKAFHKKRASIQVSVPNSTILKVLPTLNFFTPDEETEEFFTKDVVITPNDDEEESEYPDFSDDII